MVRNAGGSGYLHQPLRGGGRLEWPTSIDAIKLPGGGLEDPLEKAHESMRRWGRIWTFGFPWNTQNMPLKHLSCVESTG